MSDKWFANHPNTELIGQYEESIQFCKYKCRLCGHQWIAADVEACVRCVQHFSGGCQVVPTHRTAQAIAAERTRIVTILKNHAQYARFGDGKLTAAFVDELGEIIREVEKG